MNAVHNGAQSWRFDAPSLTRRKMFTLVAGAGLATGGGALPVFAQTTGTPAPAAGPAPVMDLLACASTWYLELESDTNRIWFYDDFQQQLDAFGIEPDFTDGTPDGLVLVTLPMLRRSDVFDYAQIDILTDAIGFQPLAVHQSLEIGDLDHHLTLFRGGIDMAALPPLWEAAGYTLQPSSTGHEIWTLGGPGDFDFVHPIQQYVFDRFNNVAVLGGDILAYSHDYAILERAADTRVAGAGSLASDPATASLLAQLPPTTVSCYAVPGGWMDTPAWGPDEEFFWADSMTESVAAVGPMPPFTSMLLGATVGLRADDPDSDVETFPIIPESEGTVVVRILAGSPEDAVQIGRVVEQRWATGHSIVASLSSARVPYADFMTIDRIDVEGSIATIDFSPVMSVGYWNSLLETHDFFPFIFGPVQD
jgi:hypothetical protein